MLSGTTVSEFIAGNFLYVLLAWAVGSIWLRRFGKSASRKRVALMLQMLGIFVILAASAAIVELGGTDIYLVIAVIVVGIVLATVLRDRALPYRRRCPDCGASLDLTTIIARDDNLCPKCRPSDDQPAT